MHVTNVLGHEKGTASGVDSWASGYIKIRKTIILCQWEANLQQEEPGWHRSHHHEDRAPLFPNQKITLYMISALQERSPLSLTVASFHWELQKSRRFHRELRFSDLIFQERNVWATVRKIWVIHLQKLTQSMGEAQVRPESTSFCAHCSFGTTFLHSSSSCLSSTLVYILPITWLQQKTPTAVTFKATKSRQFVLQARTAAGAGRGTDCSPSGKHLSFFLCACKATLHFSWENLRTNKESGVAPHIQESFITPTHPSFYGVAWSWSVGLGTAVRVILPHCISPALWRINRISCDIIPLPSCMAKDP